MLRSNVILLSFAAPSTAGFVGTSPKGPDKIEERRKKRQSSRLFFGYFLKAAQKKVSRLRVRIPD
jgi:hypothetical protein